MPIRLALLGYDEAVQRLASAAARDSRFVLTASFDVLHPQRLPTEIPQPVAGDHWEALLDGTRADGVLVAAAGGEERIEQLRKLVQEGVPVLVAHPCHDGMIVYYELDMIRQHSGSLLIPYIPSRWHPALGRAAQFVAEKPFGTVEQLVIERRMLDRTQTKVCRWFSVDADLARQLLGEQTRIAAMGAAQSDSPYASLGVQLSGPSGVLVRWSVAPVEDEPGGVLKLIAERGQATLLLPEQGAWSWTVQASGEKPTETATFEGWDSAPSALADFAQQIQQLDAPGFAGSTGLAPTWLDAARSAELADEAQRSLLKGKTLELYYGEFTEHNVFKGRMAALGCGLLWLSLMTILIAALALKMGIRAAQHWPWFLLVILGGFLTLQLLKLIVPPDQTGADAVRQEQEDPEAF